MFNDYDLLLEHAFLSNVQIVNSETEDEDHASLKSRKLISDKTASNFQNSFKTYKLIGTLPVTKNFYVKSIEKLTQQIRQSVEIANLPWFRYLDRRVLLQLNRHQMFMKDSVEKMKKVDVMNIQKQSDNSSVMLQIGIQSLFHLIEVMSMFIGPQYDILCTKIIKTVGDTLKNLPPLALCNESEECLSIIQNFLCERIWSPNVNYEMCADQNQVITCLINLYIARGKANLIFKIIDILLSIPSDSPIRICYSVFNRLSGLNKNLEYPILFEANCSIWSVDTLEFCKFISNEYTASEDYTQYLREHGATSSIATDGSYLYIHFEHGLVKVGTGFNETIRGHLYASNFNFFPNYHLWSSLIFISNTLYFWSPMLKTSDLDSIEHDEASSLPAGSHMLIRVSAENLEKTSEFIIFHSGISQRARLVTDGKYAYLAGNSLIDSVSKQDLSGSKLSTHSPVEYYFGSENVKQHKFANLVEVYDFLSDTPEKCLARVELKIPDDLMRHVKILNNGIKYMFPLGNISMNSIYTTGIYLVVMMCSRYSGEINFRESPKFRTDEIRVFHLQTGNLVAVYSTGITTQNSANCFKMPKFCLKSTTYGLASYVYDCTNNYIYSFQNNYKRVGCFFNSGAPSNNIDNQVSFYYEYAKNTPEQVFNAPKFKSISNENLIGLSDCIVLLIAHLDRISRSHFAYYSESFFELKRSNNNSSLMFLSQFISDFSLNSIVVLCSILEKFCSQSNIEFYEYCCLATVKLLKINVKDLMLHTQHFDSENLKSLNLIAKKLTELQANTSNFYLFKEINNVFINGFEKFFCSASEKVFFIEQQLRFSTPNDHLFKKLAQVKLLENLILEDHQVVGSYFDEFYNNDESGRQRQFFEGQYNMRPEFANLVTNLLEYSFKRSIHELETTPQSVNAYGSDLFLCSIQRYLLALCTTRSTLINYCLQIIDKCIRLSSVFIDYIQQDSEKVLSVLEHSILCVVLFPLFTGLLRDAHCKNLKTVLELKKAIKNLIQSLNRLSSLLPELKNHNNIYLKRLAEYIEVSTVVQTQHPYLRKNIKNKFFFSNAYAILISFDKKCKTLNNDVLHITCDSLLDSNSYVFTHNSWPKNPIIVVGDTISFNFQVSSKDRISESWGWKCYLKSLPFWYENPFRTHPLLDLNNTVASLAIKCASKLLNSKKITELDTQHSKLVESGILNNRVMSMDVLNDSELTQKNDIVNELESIASKPNLLYDFLNNYYKNNRLFFRTHATEVLEKVERYVLTAIIYHSNLLNTTRFILNNGTLSVYPDINHIDFVNKENFLLYAKKTIQFLVWISSRIEIENLWQTVVTERIEDIDQFEQIFQNHLIISTLCEMKNVNFTNDMEENVKQLFNKMIEDIRYNENNNTLSDKNYCQTVTDVVIDRCRFLFNFSANENLKDASDIVISFCKTSAPSISSLEKMIHTQNLRARNRISGLNYFDFLLTQYKNTNNISIIHQVLKTLFSELPLHYLDNVVLAGSLIDPIKNSFKKLFLNTILFMKKHLDHTSTLISLPIFTIQYKVQDAEMFENFQFLLHLQKLVLSNPKFLLKSVVWKSFILIITRCSQWIDELNSNHSLDKEGNLYHSCFKLTEQILLFISRLRNTSKIPEKYQYQIFSLVYAVIDCFEHLKFSLEIENYVKFLNKNVNLRTQRLILRIIRKLLLAKNDDLAIYLLQNTLFNFIIEKIKIWLMFEIPSFADNSKTFIKFKKTKSITQLDRYDKYNLYLVSINDYKKFQKACDSPVMSFSLGKYELADIGSIYTQGYHLIKTGSKKEMCSTGAILNQFGLEVQICHADCSIKNQRCFKNSFRDNMLHHSLNWINGYNAASLLSEYISQARFLINNHLTDLNVISEKIQSAHEVLVEGQNFNCNIEKIWDAIASFYILIDYSEPIKVGGKVAVDFNSAERKEHYIGTVVEYEPIISNKVHVLLDSEINSNLIHVVTSSHVEPIPEFKIDFDQFSDFVISILPKVIFIAFYLLEKEQDVELKNIRLLEQLKSAAMNFLLKLASSNIKTCLFDNLSSQISSLFLSVKRGNTVFINQPHRLISLLTQRLWDTVVSNLNSKVYLTVKYHLPYLPWAEKLYNYPLGWCVNNNLNTFIWSMNWRQVEFLDDYGCSSDTESLLVGDSSFPTASDWYFEVYVDKIKAKSNLVLGVIPEYAINPKKKNWTKDSYVFRFNETVLLTNFSTVDGNVNRVCVGCGYTHSSKSLYFTRNGAHLALMHKIQHEMAFLPAVSISQGCKITANFGQEPFVYKILLKPSEETFFEQESSEKRNIFQGQSHEEDNLEFEREKTEEVAKPILAMGYTMTQALTALRMTSETGVVGAVTWLLENPDYKFEDENFKTNNDSKDANYALCSLQNCFFKEELNFEGCDGDANLNNSHRPSNFMSSLDSFGEEQAYFRDGENMGYLEYVPHQFTDLLNRIQLKSKEDKNVFKPSRLSVGMLVQIDRNFENENEKFKDKNSFKNFGFIRYINVKKRLVLLQFVDSENCSVKSSWYATEKIRKIVRNSNYHNQNADSSTLHSNHTPQLHLDESNKSNLEKYFELNYKKLKILKNDPKSDFLHQNLTCAYSYLSKVYSRRILLNLIDFQFLTSPFTVDAKRILELLYLAYLEFLDNERILNWTHTLIYETLAHNCQTHIFPACIIQYLKEMDAIGEKICQVLHTLPSDKAENLVSCMTEKIVKLFAKNQLHSISVDSTMFKNSAISSSDVVTSKIGSNLWRVHLSDAQYHSVVLNSSQKNSFSNSKIQFFSDKQCKNLLYSSSNVPSMPFLINGDTLYIRFEGGLPHTHEFNISIVPISSKIFLAAWLSEFIINKLLAYNPSIDKIFYAILTCISCCLAPTTVKELLTSLLSNIITKFKFSCYEYLSSNYLESIVDLEKEMIAYYYYEKSNVLINSTYLQNLIELVSLIKLLKLNYKIHLKHQRSSFEQSIIDKKSHDTIDDAAMEENFFSFSDDRNKLELDTINKRRAAKFITENDVWHQTNCVELYNFDDKDYYQHEESANNFKSDSNTLSYDALKKLDNQDENLNFLNQIVSFIKLVDLFFPAKDFNTSEKLYYSKEFLKPTLKLKIFQILSKLILIKLDCEIGQKIPLEFKDALIDYFKRNYSTVVSPSLIYLSENFPNLVMLRLDNTEKFTKNQKKQLKLLFDTKSFKFSGTLYFVNDSGFNLDDITKTHLIQDYGQFISEYLKKRLVNSENLATDEFENFLKEFFCQFSTDHTLYGLMRDEELDAMQQFIIQEDLVSNVKNYLFQNYETKLDSCLNPGLTFNGFKEVYVVQAIANPLYTWKEILLLGYNLDLIKYVYSSVEEATECLFQSTNQLSTDLELKSFVEEVSNFLGLSSPLKLEESCLNFYLNLLSNKMSLNLSKFDFKFLVLRFKLLKKINYLIDSILPFVNLDGEGAIVQYLLKCKNLIFQNVKMSFFYNILDKTGTCETQPTVVINRLKFSTNFEPQHDFFGESELENTAFGLAYLQLKHLSPVFLRQRKPQGTEPHFSLKIIFHGENVEGEGGPYRQFFTDVSKELRSKLPLFIPCPNAHSKVGNNRDKYIIKPSFNSVLALKLYRFLGQLMGMAVRTGVLLSLNLPALFWKLLIGQKATISDLKDVDQSFVNSLEYIEYCDTKNPEGICDYGNFEILLSDSTRCLLKPHGDQVSIRLENKKEFVRLATQARIEESLSQTKEIFKGLTDILPAPLLKILTWQDLEWKVCGRPFVDIQLLKRHTKYAVGLSADEPYIKNFWEILESFSQNDRKAFVRFAWAQDRLPSNDQEFRRTQTRMFIKPYLGKANPDVTFPKADTCFFNLTLPKYSNLEIMKNKLLIAIHTDSHSMDADNPREQLEDSIYLHSCKTALTFFNFSCKPKRFYQSQQHLNSFNTISTQLKQNGPGFSFKSSNLEVLHEPKTFYNSLMTSLSSAKNRICLSSLYLGDDSESLKIIDTIFEGLKKKPDLQVTILLDCLRSTRSHGLFHNYRRLSVSMKRLHKLKHQFPLQVSIHLYHTPQLNGILKFVIPNRFKELLGVYHIKSYIIDNNLLISGANLSGIYFNNRQDRYLWLRNADFICEFYLNVFRTIGIFSFYLDEQGKLLFPSSLNPVFHPKEFAVALEAKILELFNNSLSSVDNSDDTIVFPTLQLKSCGIDYDRQVTNFVLNLANQNSRSTFVSSPYFNITEEYKSRFCNVSEDSKIQLVVSSPECNAFYKGGILLGQIPWFYSSTLEKFYCSLLKHENLNACIEVGEYSRDNWTFHSKGIWLDFINDSSLFLTLLGSSNFGFRSVYRDVESQLLILTKNQKLKNQFLIETTNILKHSKTVTHEVFEERKKKQSLLLPLISGLAVKFM